MNDTSPDRVYRDVTCTGCGCVCDDLVVTANDHRIVDFAPACNLAEDWLRNIDSETEAARIEGNVATMDEAIGHAASILRKAKNPLIYGLSRSSTPGQREAVRLADVLGANIDTTASVCHAPSIMALQNSGESTSTLGEVRNRSDLVVYWGSNPLVSHPRHFERFVDSPGMFVPTGRAGRHVVVVDVEATETSALADTFLRVDPNGDFEFINALRCQLKRQPLSCQAFGGIAANDLRAFAEMLQKCTYGAFFFGLGLTRHGIAHANVELLLRLTNELNDHTRFVARRMRVPGDVAGADSVLCWQTGFPFSVNLARGYPRYNPGEYTADSLLARGEVDATLMVGSEGIDQLSNAAANHLSRIPNIILDYPSVVCPAPATVHFTTAVYGCHRAGTAYRMDEVPIPLRAVLHSPLPADHEILNAVRQHV